MKVAIYARVSTRDKGQDVRNQLEELRAYCDKRGWHIVNVGASEKQSHFSRNRPEP